MIELRFVKSTASPDEYASPFYQEHHRLSLEWERFITDYDGKVIGKISPWALLIKAKISLKSNWYFEVKKLTMSNDSLLLPSSWNVLTYTIVKSNDFEIESPSFELKRKSTFDVFRIKRLSKWRNFKNDYLLSSSDENVEAYLENSLFKDFINAEDLERIKYEHTTKKLEIRFQILLKDTTLLKKLL